MRGCLTQSGVRTVGLLGCPHPALMEHFSHPLQFLMFGAFQLYQLVAVADSTS